MPKKRPASSGEEAKRLAPSQDVLRELFLKSGNLCAFPACNELMMNRAGLFVGQVCHIEAAEKGGPRFNVNMDNESRRAFENLMLMCYAHHKETDDEKNFPTARLRAIKKEHEDKFSHPGRAMLEELKDWTTHETPKLPKTLASMNNVLGWKNDAKSLAECVDDVCKLVERFRNVPAASRKIMGLLADRRHRLAKQERASYRDNFELLVEDARNALQMSFEDLRMHIRILKSHNFVDIDRNDNNDEIFIFYGVVGWNFWTELPKFTEARQIPIDKVTVELRFDLLDA